MARYLLLVQKVTHCSSNQLPKDIEVLTTRCPKTLKNLDNLEVLATSALFIFKLSFKINITFL